MSKPCYYIIRLCNFGGSNELIRSKRHEQTAGEGQGGSAGTTRGTPGHYY